MAAASGTLGTADSDASLLAPLRVRDFRVSLAIQIGSSVRQPMQFFTQTWFINTVAPADQRVAMLGLLATLQGISYLTWVLFGSAISDRVPRRTALLVTHLAGAVWLGGTALLLRIPSVVHGDGIWFWIMLVVFAEFGVMNAQDIPARTAVASETVPASMRTRAITLHWLAFAVALLVAAPSTGWLIGRIGFANIYLLAMGSHLLTALGLRFLRAARALGHAAVRVAPCALSLALTRLRLVCRSSAHDRRMTGVACLQSAWSGPSWGRASSRALSSRRLPRPVTTSSRCWCVLGPAVTRCQACC